MAKRSNEYRKKKKLDPLITNGIREISIFDIQFLRKFVSENGKILPRRITGCSARSQKKVAQAVKRARNIGLLPIGRSYEKN